MAKELILSSAEIWPFFNGLSQYQIGQAIRIWRRQCDISVAEIGQRAFIKPCYIYGIERGDWRIHDHQITGIVARLCEDKGDLKEIVKIAKSIPSSLGEMRKQRPKRSLLCLV